MTREGLGLLRDTASLLKIPIALAVAAAGFLGHVAAAGTSSSGTAATVFALFFLSCGAAALNAIQDRRLDSAMERTRHRPIPEGRIAPRVAALVAFLFLAAGTIILAGYTDSAAVAAGFLTVILYNGLYTPLKRRTQWALVPGILSGMMPPLIGWFAAGGGVPSSRLWYLMILYGTWQVPHFWLILLKRGDDYRRCGIPTILDHIPELRLRSLVFIWITGFGVLTLFTHLFGVTSHPAVTVALMINAVFITIRAAHSLLSCLPGAACRGLVMHLNLTTLAPAGAALFDTFLR